MRRSEGGETRERWRSPGLEEGGGLADDGPGASALASAAVGGRTEGGGGWPAAGVVKH